MTHQPDTADLARDEGEVLGGLLASVDRHLADMKDYGMNYAVVDLRKAADEARPLIEGKQ